MDDFFSDLRLAIRGLARRPTLTTIAVLTLALGVGANTAIFSVVHGVLLRPLGFTAEERLVAVVATNKAEGEARPGSSFSDYWFYRHNQSSLSDLGFYGWSSMTLEEPGRVQQLEGLYVSSNLFDLLGVEPVRGRRLREEDAVSGIGSAALVSHGAWQRLWGGREEIIGQPVRVDGRDLVIAGVMPESLSMPSPHAEIWVPVGHFEHDLGRFGREERDFLIVGRLAPAATAGQAGTEMSQLARSLGADFPATNGDWDAHVVPLRDHLVGDSRRPILIAFAAVAMVLLLACANISHLLLVRCSGREREMSVRAALGAGRRRLAQLVLVESAVLALSGGLVGSLFAAWLQDVLLSLDPGILSRAEQIAFDGPVLLFALLVSLLTGLLCGVLPATHSSRVLHAALHAGGRRTVGGRGGAWRQLLLGFEVALALVLLAGAGLLVRSLYQLDRVDPGFDPAGTHMAHFILDDSAYDGNDARIAFFSRLQEEVAAQPGIDSAALSTTPPVPQTGILIDVPYRGEKGPSLDQGTSQRAAFRIVTPGYFDTVGMPLLAGRDVEHGDVNGGQLVAVVNRALAERLWGPDPAVGRRFEIDFGGAFELEVVGVVGDTRFAGLHAAPRPALFLAHKQVPFRGMAVVVRSSLPAAAVADALRRAASRIDPLVPPGDLISLEHRLERSIGLERFFATLLGIFALLAVVLAAAGIFGVFSYWVSQRTNEIGVRMALGAEARQVIAMVVWQGLAVTGGGLAAGTAGALMVQRLLSRSFQGVAGGDAFGLLAVVLLLAAVAACSCLVPALRASRIEPTAALRAE